MGVYHGELKTWLNNLLRRFFDTDPNSMGGKILFSVIEKVIIGIIALLLVMYFQNRASQNQKISDATLSVTRIYSDIIVKQRDSLLKAMEDYFLILEDIKPVGQANEIQDKILNDLWHKIRFNIYTLGGVDKRIKEQAEPFLNSITDLNLLLEKKITPKKEIEANEDELLNFYMNLLENIRKITKEKVKQEFKEIR
jgi:hypothetical protein